MINVTDNFFEYVRQHPQYKVVVYGAGNLARNNYKYLGRVDYFCDRNAEEIKSIDNIACITPQQLAAFPDKTTVLICIQNRDVADEICRTLEELKVNAEVFYFYDNPAFSRFDYSKYQYVLRKEGPLRIRLVYANDGWIFGKFANKLQSELTKLGQIVEIGETEDPDADVNHFISYGMLGEFVSDKKTVKTTMITHIDSLMKRDLIAYQAQEGAVGICMSADTLNKLSVWGVPRDKLCYINPAQDGEIRPKKIVLGITNRCYGWLDCRKRDDMIVVICRELNPQYFKWKIMGSGWDEIVNEMRELGFEVEYYPEFEREIYKNLMPSLDYWIYYGFDEGAMGFLDALAAGVKTIVTPQGYHMDVKCGLTYPCSTKDDFVAVLKNIQKEKADIVSAVKDWTWENYAKKHLEIWQYLTHRKSFRELYVHQSEYMDGIFSVLVSDINAN